jgi:hypothetical protein
VVFWFVTPCSLLTYTDVSEGYVVFVFRVELCRLRNWFGYGRGFQESWWLKPREGCKEMEHDLGHRLLWPKRLYSLTRLHITTGYKNIIRALIYLSVWRWQLKNQITRDMKHLWNVKSYTFWLNIRIIDIYVHSGYDADAKFWVYIQLLQCSSNVQVISLNY